jgi:hypothetical protein
LLPAGSASTTRAATWSDPTQPVRTVRVAEGQVRASELRWGAEIPINLGGDAIPWRRGPEKATVAVRRPVREVLLVLYRRLPIDTETVEVLGDRGVLEGWLDAVSLAEPAAPLTWSPPNPRSAPPA